MLQISGVGVGFGLGVGGVTGTMSVSALASLFPVFVSGVVVVTTTVFVLSRPSFFGHFPDQVAGRHPRLGL